MKTFDPGEHLQCFVEEIGRWRCKRCLRTSVKPLRGRDCNESWQELKHALAAVGKYVVCLKCGSFTCTKPVNLLEQCKKVELKSSQGQRLIDGHDPYTNEYIAKPVPWRVGSLNHCTVGSGATWRELYSGIVDLGEIELVA